jgi:hypothetical protein
MQRTFVFFSHFSAPRDLNVVSLPTFPFRKNDKLPQNDSTELRKMFKHCKSLVVLRNK